MKVERIPLILSSSEFSREYGVERSDGVHVSQIIERLKRTHSPSQNYGDNGAFSEQDLERLRALGFIWERTMIEEDDELSNIYVVGLDPERREMMWELALEKHAKSVVNDPGLEFPGERMFCPVCEAVYFGGKIGRAHCRRTGHKGIFFTVDAVMKPPRYRRGTKEWKLTARSAGRTGPDHLNGIWEWPVQTMFYCDMYGTNYAEIDAMFTRGDYTTKKPQMLPFRFKVEYTAAELHRNRVMLISTARSEGWID